MKRFLRLFLIIIFCLITENEIWKNLSFSPVVPTIIKVALVLTIFELVLKPIIKILLLPINILTLGTIRIVINTLGLYIAIFLISGFQINNFTAFNFKLEGFFAYLASSLTISFLLYIFNIILYRKKS
ncbi:MAG: phage holin family protein [Candidatus Shapirobacteria bacterium]|jgi:putative membrane protein